MNSENTNDILNNDGVEGGNDITKTMLRSAYSSDDTMTVTAPDKPKTEPSGGRDKDNNSSGNGVSRDPAFDRQLLAIYKDPVFQEKLGNIRYTAWLFNIDADVKATDVDVNGTVTVSVFGLTSEEASKLDLMGLVLRVDGYALGDIYTGHKLGKLDKPLPNNKDKLSEAEVANSILGATISASQGKIPVGYILQDGKIGYMEDVYSKTSLGHAEWQYNYSGTKFTESPELTKTYNEGVKQKKEAEIRAKELAEAKSLGITDVEYNALKAVRLAQNKLNETTQRIAKATTAKSNAEKAVVQHEAAVKKVTAELKKIQDEMDVFIKYHILNESEGDWFGEVKRYEYDIANKKNNVTSANDKLAEAKKTITQVDLDLKKAKDESSTAAAVLEKAKQEEVSVKDAVKFTADFYKEALSKYGQKAGALSRELADAAYGKRIKGVDDALKAFDKYKNVLNKKYSAADRKAISNALSSVKHAEFSANLNKFSKAFSKVGGAIDAYDAVIELGKAIETQNWRPFFVKIETLMVGRVAGVAAAFAFSIIAGSALGILGFGLVLALVGAVINEEYVEKVNKAIGI